MEKILLIAYLLGQILEIIGAFLLFRYSLPPFVQRFSYQAQQGGENPTDEMLSLDKLYAKTSKRGFALIWIGFCLQVPTTLYNLYK